MPRLHNLLQETSCSCSSFAAALHPLPTTCSVSRDHSHAIRRLDGLQPLLQHYQCATLLETPRPGHSGHPFLLVPGTVPSSAQLGVWQANPSLGRGFPRLLGHCSPTRSTKGSVRRKARGKFHPEQPVQCRCSSQVLLFAIFYKSFSFRPQISFKLVEIPFTSAGFGSGPSEVKKPNR